MSKNTGKDFELLTLELYSEFTAKDPTISVEHDVQFAGPDGPRQIDILRYNTRHVTDFERAAIAAKGIQGKRLTYRRTGKRQARP